MSDKKQDDQQTEPLEPREQGTTGVLETGGSGLYHTDANITSGPETGKTPQDVSQANPFANVDLDSAAGDVGQGMDTTGKQFEYPGVGEIVEES